MLWIHITFSKLNFEFYKIPQRADFYKNMKIECVRENLNRKADRFQWFDFLSGAAIGACVGMGLLMLAGLL